MAEVDSGPESPGRQSEAMEIMKRYAGEAGIPPARQQELERLQRLASASVAKKTEFQSRVTEIRGLLETGKTIDAIGVQRPTDRGLSGLK